MTGHQDITGSTYVVQVAQTLWENLPQVLLVALLFNLICIPAAFLFTSGSFIPSFLVASITIGPAWVALLANEMRLLQGRSAKAQYILPCLPPALAAEHNSEPFCNHSLCSLC